MLAVSRSRIDPNKGTFDWDWLVRCSDPSHSTLPSHSSPTISLLLCSRKPTSIMPAPNTSTCTSILSAGLSTMANCALSTAPPTTWLPIRSPRSKSQAFRCWTWTPWRLRGSVGTTIFPESPEVVLHAYCHVSVPFFLIVVFLTSHSPAVLIVLAHSHATETSHLLWLLVFVRRTVLRHTSDVCHPECNSEAVYLQLSAPLDFVSLLKWAPFTSKGILRLKRSCIRDVPERLYYLAYYNTGLPAGPS